MAGSLLRLLNERVDRLPYFTGVDWTKVLAWLQARTGTDLVPGQEAASG